MSFLFLVSVVLFLVRRICPSDRFCRAQNLPTSSVELIWPITGRYDLIVLHLLAILFFLVRKNPVYRDSNSRPNVSKGYEVTSELPGRPASPYKEKMCESTTTKRALRFFVYFQVNTGVPYVLDYVEDIYDGGPLYPVYPSPRPMYLPL